MAGERSPCTTAEKAMIVHLSPTHGKVACLAQPSKLYASRCNARLYPKPFASAWVFKMKGATFGFNEELAS